MSLIGSSLAVENHLKVGCHRHNDIHQVGMFTTDSLLDIRMKSIRGGIVHAEQREQTVE